MIVQAIGLLDELDKVGRLRRRRSARAHVACTEILDMYQLHSSFLVNFHSIVTSAPLFRI